MKHSREKVIVIKPDESWLKLNFRELVEFRDLFFFLTWRDIKVRYKQTIIGAAWAILQPLLTMVVFTVFFNRLAGLKSDGAPYELFSYAALVPWQFFASGITNSATSMVSNERIITKVYFPRIIIPVSSILSSLVDFALAFGVLIIMIFAFGMIPTINIIWLPLLLLLALVTAVGVGLWLAALNVQFRDVRYVLPFLVQIWMFATPIAYPSSLLSEPWKTLYGINPMVGVVEGFRWALLGTETRPGAIIIVSIGVSLLIFFSGLGYFQKMEEQFADII
jgi:lipopolysaccharide transport system permease protein